MANISCSARLVLCSALHHVSKNSEPKPKPRHPNMKIVSRFLSKPSGAVGRSDAKAWLAEREKQQRSSPSVEGPKHACIRYDAHLVHEKREVVGVDVTAVEGQKRVPVVAGGVWRGSQEIEPFHLRQPLPQVPVKSGDDTTRNTPPSASTNTRERKAGAGNKKAGRRQTAPFASQSDSTEKRRRPLLRTGEAEKKKGRHGRTACCTRWPGISRRYDPARTPGTTITYVDGQD